MIKISNEVSNTNKQANKQNETLMIVKMLAGNGINYCIGSVLQSSRYLELLHECHIVAFVFYALQVPIALVLCRQP